MASRDWSIEGRYVESCSCHKGCPCEAMGIPSAGYCTGAVGFIVDKGHCEDVSLDGNGLKYDLNESRRRFPLG